LFQFNLLFYLSLSQEKKQLKGSEERERENENKNKKDDREVSEKSGKSRRWSGKWKW
jgi:hypothetical protein